MRYKRNPYLLAIFFYWPPLGVHEKDWKQDSRAERSFLLAVQSYNTCQGLRVKYEYPFILQALYENKMVVACPQGKEKRHTGAQDSALKQTEVCRSWVKDRTHYWPKIPYQFKADFSCYGDRAGNLPVFWIQNLVGGRGCLSLGEGLKC